LPSVFDKIPVGGANGAAKRRWIEQEQRSLTHANKAIPVVLAVAQLYQL
jgi:hypothetical protein